MSSATLNETCGALKLATTDCAADIVTEQTALLPLQAPLHAAKLEPADGVAVSTTRVPAGKVVAQLVPQLMPAGFETTAPPPLPWRATFSAKLAGAVPASSQRLSAAL